jgi:hypothetical protein
MIGLGGDIFELPASYQNSMSRILTRNYHAYAGVCFPSRKLTPVQMTTGWSLAERQVPVLVSAKMLHMLLTV